ncbi:MAG: hypothetical protein RI988_643 [Pseudomonadota bacterium]|jgi:hypothetical protein
MVLRLLVLLAAAFAIGWYAAPPPLAEPELVRPKRPDPALPELAGPVMLEPAQLSQLATAPFWGAPPPSAAAPAPPPPDMRWRVSGVFGMGVNRKLRVEFRDPARPPVTLKAGEKLPSGHVITRIDERTYCVDIDGASYTLGVEKSE